MREADDCNLVTEKTNFYGVSKRQVSVLVLVRGGEATLTRDSAPVAT
jgi:hypothetical protein